MARPGGLGDPCDVARGSHPPGGPLRSGEARAGTRSGGRRGGVGSREELKQSVRHLEVSRAAPAALRQLPRPLGRSSTQGAPQAALSRGRSAALEAAPWARGRQPGRGAGRDSGCGQGPCAHFRPEFSPPCLVMAMYTKHEFGCFCQF